MHNKFLNLFKIKVLTEVCKTNHYKTAGERLFISASAVSKIIKELENDWGIQLVQSSGNAIKVTPIAIELSCEAQKVLRANEQFFECLGILKGNATSKIHIASGGTHTKLLMNKIVVALMQRFPNAEFDTTVLNSKDVLELIQNNKLDFGVVTGQVPDTLEKQLLLEDHIYLYAHKTNPLCEKKLSLSSISNLICMREKGSSTRELVDAYLKKRKILLPATLQTGKNDELVDFISRTQQALQFMSAYYFSNSQWKENYVQLNCTDIHIPLSVYFVGSKNPSYKRVWQSIKILSSQADFLSSWKK